MTRRKHDDIRNRQKKKISSPLTAAILWKVFTSHSCMTKETQPLMRKVYLWSTSLQHRRYRTKISDVTTHNCFQRSEFTRDICLGFPPTNTSFEQRTSARNAVLSWLFSIYIEAIIGLWFYLWEVLYPPETPIRVTICTNLSVFSIHIQRVYTAWKWIEIFYELHTKGKNI